MLTLFSIGVLLAMVEGTELVEVEAVMVMLLLLLLLFIIDGSV